jgi:ribosome-associated protein
MIPGVDDPMPIAPGVAVPLSEVELRTSRSSGPGGQHANVTDSRVEAVFDVIASTALGPGPKARIVERLGPRPRAVAQEARGQSRNREMALERLRERLAGALREAPARHPTRPGRAARERRLEGKRRTGERKAQRRRPPGEDG